MEISCRIVLTLCFAEQYFVRPLSDANKTVLLNKLYQHLYRNHNVICIFAAFKRSDLDYSAVIMYARINIWDLSLPQDDQPLISPGFIRKPQITNFHYTKIPFNWINVPDRRFQKLRISNLIKKKVWRTMFLPIFCMGNA